MPTVVKDVLTTTASQARYLLELETMRGGVFVDLDRALDYYVYHINTARPHIEKMKLMVGEPRLHPNQKEDIKRVLVQKLGVSEHLLMTRDHKLSINQEILDQVLTNDYVTDMAKEFITNYIMAKDHLYLSSYMEQYINNPVLKVESFEGHRMVLARPTWTVLVTGRISAKSPSVQNISREVNDIFTYPEGYLMLYSDSGQIEPRIRYSAIIKDPVIKQLIIVYDDAYYGQLHYCQMTDEEYAQAYMNPEAIKPKEVTKEMGDTRSELKTILLKGTYGSMMTDVDPVLYGQFKKRILNHPLNKELEDSIREYVQNGGDTFYSPFGSAVTPEEKEKYRVGTLAHQNHLVRCGLNNPLQSAAADCMNEAVNRATMILKYEATPASFIGYMKHDEGLFYLAPGDHHLKDKLRDCMSYDVEINGEKWIPIRSDEHIGKKKGNPNVPVI